MGTKSRLPATLDDHAATTTDIARRPAAHIVTHHRDRPPASDGPVSALLESIANARPAWHQRAACRGRTGMFFGDEHGRHEPSELAQARELCKACPVQHECAQEAAQPPTSHVHGIWAGLTQEERRTARRRAQQRRLAG